MDQTRDTIEQRLMRLERVYEKVMLSCRENNHVVSSKSQQSFMASRVPFAAQLRRSKEVQQHRSKVTSKELLQRIRSTRPSMRFHLERQLRGPLQQQQRTKKPVLVGLKHFFERENERRSLPQRQLVESKQLYHTPSVMTDDTSAITSMTSSDESADEGRKSSPDRRVEHTITEIHVFEHKNPSETLRIRPSEASPTDVDVTSVAKGEFKLEHDSVTDVTLAVTDSSSSCNDNSCFEESSFGASQISISKSRSFNSKSSCRTIPEEPINRVSKQTLLQMRKQAEALEFQTQFSKDKAEVVKNDMQFHTAVLLKEQLYLEDSKDTAYEELKDLLIDESREAERLHIRLKKLKRQQSIIRKVAIFGLLLSYVTAFALAVASQSLSREQWHHICAPVRTGTRITTSAADDRMEAPWWVPEEYNSWKRPLYHLVGCSQTSPRVAVELSHGMLWVTQLSTGKVLFKKPATNVFVKSDKLEVLDQRTGSYIEIDLPWST